MDVNIRIASLEDIDCLVQLISAFRDYPEVSAFPTEASFRADLPGLISDPNTELLIAGSSGDPCLGFLQQRYRHSLWLSAPEAYIEDLFVVDRARRQGIGQRLVEFAVQRAQARSCPLISVDTMERNEEAVRFHERLDFSCRSERRGLRLLFRRWLDTGAAPRERRS